LVQEKAHANNPRRHWLIPSLASVSCVDLAGKQVHYLHHLRAEVFRHPAYQLLSFVAACAGSKARE